MIRDLYICIFWDQDYLDGWMNSACMGMAGMNLYVVDEEEKL